MPRSAALPARSSAAPTKSTARARRNRATLAANAVFSLSRPVAMLLGFTRWRWMMIKYIAPVLAVAAAALVSPSLGFAQDAPPTYAGAPGVYKLILDNERFRVIRAVWRPGQLDAPHSHPIPSVVFPLTDCTIKLTSAEGTR